MGIKNLGDRLANRIPGILAKKLVSFFERKVLNYYKKFDKTGLNLVNRTWETEDHVFFSPHELFMIFSIAKAQKDHGGAFAEVGVFKGASATVLSQVKNSETDLYLFDTFEGLQDTGDLDSRFSKHMFTADEKEVREKLKIYKNVHVAKGFFPNDTGHIIEREKFSFVHLDVDTYNSMFACLEYFRDRLLPGGIVLAHDYAQCEGVHKAFLEFLKNNIQFKAIELSVTQIMLLKQ